MFSKRLGFAIIATALAAGIAGWLGYSAGAAQNGAALRSAYLWSPGPIGYSTLPIAQAPSVPADPLPAEPQPPRDPVAPQTGLCDSCELPCVAAPVALIDPNVSLASHDLVAEGGALSRVAFDEKSLPSSLKSEESSAAEPTSPVAGSDADASAATAPAASETASTILDMRNKLGSVLDSTVFAPQDKDDVEAQRQEIIDHIRRFEEEHAAPGDGPPAAPAGCSCSPCRCRPCQCGGVSTSVAAGTAHALELQNQAIGSLREVSAQLDQLANELERTNLYDQADHLRGVAQQLREDARAVTRGQCPCQHVRERFMDEAEAEVKTLEYEQPPQY